MVQLWTAVISLLAGVVTTIVTVLYGPAWKNRLDGRRDRLARSEGLITQYGEPLARAAFDLQSRLYSIVRQELLKTTALDSRHVETSTMWLFGQYLAWVEILRREVQLLDLGDVRRTAELQRHLFDVTDVLASSSIADDAFFLPRTEQRAVGEIMVVERPVGDRTRTDSMGYAQFCERYQDAGFHAWFGRLRASIPVLAADPRGHLRPILLQRQLVQLIDFLDPEFVRFPEVNERGMLRLPPGQPLGVDRKRRRPPSQIARFRFVEGDPWAVLEQWSREVGARVAPEAPNRRLAEPRNRPFRRSFVLAMVYEPPWVELDAWSTSGFTRRRRPVHEERLDSRCRTDIDALLRAFDRPPLRRPG